MAVQRVQDLDVSGKKVICRVDFNVPLSKETGAITDDTRVVAALPTIKNLIERKAKVILCSHLGRPEGERNEKMSLKPVVECLSKHIGKPVAFADDCVGEVAEQAVAKLNDGDVLLLENLRFHKGETDNDAAFSKQLASLAEVYVNDAFGAAHRAHASTFGIPQHLSQKASGFLMQKELEYLGKALEAPEKPFVVILGGAKVSGKLQVITSLLPKCDAMLIGGGMVYTFLKAKGFPVGKSLVEEELVETAGQILQEAEKSGTKFLLPVDHVVAAEFKAHAAHETVAVDGIPEDKMALDIGPKTIELFSNEIKGAKTIVWNGPSGVFELEPFNAGTFAVAKAVAASGALSIVGGGDSVAAVKKAGVADQISHISTGGGASLEFLEGKELPGVYALS